MSELTRRLKAVDPDLKIIPGGTRRHSHKATNTDWEKASGFLCPKCREETVRLKEIRTGEKACPACYRRYAEKFSKMEASLKLLSNSENSKLARTFRHQFIKNMPL